MCQMCVGAQVRLFLELLQLSIWGTSWDVPLCRFRRRWRGRRQLGRQRLYGRQHSDDGVMYYHWSFPSFSTEICSKICTYVTALWDAIGLGLSRSRLHCIPRVES